MLEPLPETRDALDEYLDWSEPGMGGDLADLAARVAELVPETVALSLTLVRDDLTFTLATRSVTTAAVDAMQYLDGGPCESAVDTGDVVAVPIGDLLDEGRWVWFARAAAAVGIRSSLSLAVREHGVIIGGVNLYASSDDAFEGNHESIALLVGGRAEEAIRNADLSFSSRSRAIATPGRMRDLGTVETALGLLMARFDEDEDGARSRLERAAAQGGLDRAVLARALVDLHQPLDDPA